MSVKASPHKLRRILALFFEGRPQTEIAGRLGVDQSTISLYATRFKALADDKGLLSAAKEVGVLNEVDSLRSLSVELLRSNLSVEEAKEGVNILNQLQRLGVRSKDHKAVVAGLSRLEDPGFVAAVVRMIGLEVAAGGTYQEVLSRYEALSQDTGALQEEKARAEAELGALRGELDQLKAQCGELAATRKQLAADVAAKAKETGLTLERMVRLEPLARDLGTVGVSDDGLRIYLDKHRELDKAGLGWEQFLKLVEEVKGAGEGGIDVERLLRQLAQYLSLSGVMEALEAERVSLESGLKDLKKREATARKAVEKQQGKMGDLQRQVADVEESRSNLTKAVAQLRDEKEQLEAYLPRLRQTVSSQEARATAADRKAAALEPMVKDMEEKLVAYPEIERQFDEKSKALAQVEAQLSEGRHQLDLLKGFAGFIAANRPADLEAFLRVLPALIEKSDKDKDAQALRDHVIRRLTEGALDLLRCNNCNAQFVVVRGPREQPSWLLSDYTSRNPKCPLCGSYSIPEARLPEVLSQGVRADPKRATGRPIPVEWIDSKGGQP